MRHIHVSGRQSQSQTFRFGKFKIEMIGDVSAIKGKPLCGDVPPVKAADRSRNFRRVRQGMNPEIAEQIVNSVAMSPARSTGWPSSVRIASQATPRIVSGSSPVISSMLGEAERDVLGGRATSFSAARRLLDTYFGEKK